jgi:hypothetical protein
MEGNELFVIEVGKVTQNCFTKLQKRNGSLTLREEHKLQIFVSSMLYVPDELPAFMQSDLVWLG